MLSHQRFIRHNIIYLGRDPKTADDEYVSVLPLPWIVEQCYCLGFNLLSRMKVNFPESPETTMTDMREVGPTFVLMAPRLTQHKTAIDCNRRAGHIRRCIGGEEQQRTI